MAGLDSGAYRRFSRVSRSQKHELEDGIGARLEQHLTVRTGAMFQAAEVIRTADEKRALFEHTGALASLERAAGIAGLSNSRGE
ncbi:MAG: hypothetical protein ACREXY_08105 [Gammaproteobacteria bacterium]